MPQKWNELWDMLPKDQHLKPALPLILAAWHDTPALQKMVRLQEHIKWAAAHGSLKDISKFLRSLSEKDWFYLESP